VGGDWRPVPLNKVRFVPMESVQLLDLSGVDRSEPRWPAAIALLAVGSVRLALPAALSAGPRWIVLLLVMVLLTSTEWSRRKNCNTLTRSIGYFTMALVTADMIWSLSLLIDAIPSHIEQPGDMLRSAAALWASNVLIFASWYWRLDAGGPRARELRGVHIDGAFLFPQMTLDKESKRQMGEYTWSPGFIDYLFLAFTTSTAFSPTDTPVLSRWAKVMMMVQALISFATVAVLAARAVNIL
jgi:uncharacterized membrane protein